MVQQNVFLNNMIDINYAAPLGVISKAQFVCKLNAGHKLCSASGGGYFGKL